MPMAFVLGVGSSLLENRMSRQNLTLSGFLAIFLLYQAVLLLNGAWDEQLRWSILSGLVAIAVVFLSRMRFLSSLRRRRV